MIEKLFRFFKILLRLFVMHFYPSTHLTPNSEIVGERYEDLLNWIRISLLINMRF